MIPDYIDVDVAGWARFPEVQNYAKSRDIGLGEAIRELVNSGLSHEPVSYV